MITQLSTVYPLVRSLLNLLSNKLSFYGEDKGSGFSDDYRYQNTYGLARPCAVCVCVYASLYLNIFEAIVRTEILILTQGHKWLVLEWCLTLHRRTTHSYSEEFILHTQKPQGMNACIKYFILNIYEKFGVS